MEKINIKMYLKSSEEIRNVCLVGEKNNNLITFFDSGHFFEITYKDEQITLTKFNKEYKITINLKKNESHCIYEDLKSNSALKMRITDEDFLCEKGLIEFSYLLENINKIEYRLEYEVTNEGEE